MPTPDPAAAIEAGARALWDNVRPANDGMPAWEDADEADREECRDSTRAVLDAAAALQPEPLGWVVLTRQADGSLQPDWDGLLHADVDDAHVAALEARGDGEDGDSGPYDCVVLAALHRVEPAPAAATEGATP